MFHLVSDVDQDCTVFCGVSYLGAQNIADPKSEQDIQRIMQELSSMPENRDGIAVSISIPVCSQGLVVWVSNAWNNQYIYRNSRYCCTKLVTKEDLTKESLSALPLQLKVLQYFFNYLSTTRLYVYRILLT